MKPRMRKFKPVNFAQVSVTNGSQIQVVAQELGTQTFRVLNVEIATPKSCSIRVAVPQMLHLLPWLFAQRSRRYADDIEHHQNFLCMTPIDMRRSFDSLAEFVADAMGHDSFTGDFFVCRNSEETKIKILYWDRDGYAIWYKRLEKARSNYQLRLPDYR